MPPDLLVGPGTRSDPTLGALGLLKKKKLTGKKQ